MRLIQNLSIKRKLLLITNLTCSVALILAFVALLIYEVQTFKTDMVEDLSGQATILGGLSTAALSFDDSDTATEMLAELRHEPHIMMAVIYRDGRPFAAYRRPDVMEAYPSKVADFHEAEFRGGHLHLNNPINFKNQHLGDLFLKADMRDLYDRLWQYLAILAGVFCASLLIVFLLATGLRRVISEPIMKLSQAALAVAERQDYTVRAEKVSEDELGNLTDTFNQMLARIQAQDLELKESRERFEVAVRGTSDGLWDWDLVADEIYFSPRWKEMIGYGNHELEDTYQVWEELLHPDDRAPTIKVLKEYLAGDRGIYEVEFRMLKKDGDYCWILSRGAAARDSAGKPVRLAGSHTDISARKLADLKMREMNQQLVDASRQAGMAEVATGVLHNVGNVLNSVNVSATLVAQRTSQSKTENLKKAIELLEERKDDLGTFFTSDPKGKVLPGYLKKLSEHLTKEQKENLGELKSLTQNIEHIKQIVSMQQNYAKVSGLLEPIQVVDLLEDAVRINSLALARHRIQIIRQIEEVPTVLVDKHNVLQILVNLLSNAKHALSNSPVEPREITLQVARVSGENKIQVVIKDNGIGISGKNLERIFTHGFTTKKDGHGFGLHSGALAAKQMGGGLIAQSEGLGKGAAFILKLPLADACRQSEAA